MVHGTVYSIMKLLCTRNQNLSIYSYIPRTRNNVEMNPKMILIPSLEQIRDRRFWLESRLVRTDFDPHTKVQPKPLHTIEVCVYSNIATFWCIVCCYSCSTSRDLIADRWGGCLWGCGRGALVTRKRRLAQQPKKTSARWGGTLSAQRRKKVYHNRGASASVKMG